MAPKHKYVSLPIASLGFSAHSEAHTQTHGQDLYQRQNTGTWKDEWQEEAHTEKNQAGWSSNPVTGDAVRRRGALPETPMLLMVAEKPSIAQTLAQALSGSEKVHKRQGSSRYSPVYEYEGWFGQKWSYFRVTAVTGHVFNRDFVAEFNDWKAHEPRELFDAPTELKESDPGNRMLSHLRQEAKGCHGIVLWLDCDREGENICFEVLSVAYERLLRPKNVYRAKFSSLHHPDLRAAMEKLAFPNEHEAKSVECRQEIDLKLGVSFTRFLTLYLKQHFRQVMEALDLKVVSYGPCQAPTLWFCVKRQNEIMQFVSEPFWLLSLEAKDGQGAAIWFQRKRGCFWKEAEAAALLDRLKTVDSLNVSSVETRTKTHRKPLPLNTVALLQKASQKLRMGPARALEVAESLYLAGLTTYPRTETNKYAATFDPSELLKSLGDVGDGQIAGYARQLAGEGSRQARVDGHDAGDHPPITPVRGASWNDFRDDAARRVYELITQHFLASLSPDAETKEVCATGVAAGEEFISMSSQVSEVGWTAAYGPSAANAFLIPRGESHSGQRLDRLRQGQHLKVLQPSIEREHTSPPELITESELLGLMETHGIGTDASMATHVETIVKRSYCDLEEKRRTLKPTPLGRALCHCLVAIDGTCGLCAPPVRASIERDCDRVARGEETKDAAVARALRIFSRKLERFSNQVHIFPLMLAAAFAEAEIYKNEKGKGNRRAGRRGASKAKDDGQDSGDPNSLATELWQKAIASTAALRLEDLKKYKDGDDTAPLPTTSTSEWQLVEEAKAALSEVGFAMDVDSQPHARNWWEGKETSLRQDDWSNGWMSQNTWSTDGRELHSRKSKSGVQAYANDWTGSAAANDKWDTHDHGNSRASTWSGDTWESHGRAVSAPTKASFYPAAKRHVKPGGNLQLGGGSQTPIGSWKPSLH